MIISNTHKVETNLKNSHEFGISTDSSHLFSMLSSYLYKEKERSVITELCSNAIDAHQIVGKINEPIQVHLPTDTNNEFKVRDFGPGLSEPDVYRFLTQYGSSSKRNSDEVIGGLGIGSKSPMSVTDSWTINSHHDGMMNSYLVHINSIGVPSINKIMTSESSETGLEVVIPVKSCYEWLSAAKKVFKRYPVKPVFKGAIIDIEEPEIELNYHDLYHVYENHSCFHTAILNHREYDIDLDQINIENWFDRGITIPFDLCGLSVSLSREDLQYDTKTKTKIKERFDEIYAKLTEQWKAEVSSQPDIFSYKFAVMKFVNTYHLSATAAELLAESNDDEFAVLVNYHSLNQFKIELTKTVTEPEIRFMRIDRMMRLKMGAGNHSRMKYIKGENHYVMMTDVLTRDDIIFVLKDDDYASSRLKTAIANNTIKAIDVVVLNDVEFNQIPDIFQKVKATSFPKPIKIANAATRASKVLVKSPIFKLYGHQFGGIDEVDIDKTKKWVCIEFTDARSSRSMIDKHKGFHKEFKSECNFIYIRKGGIKPDWASTPDEWIIEESTKHQEIENDIILSFGQQHLSKFQYSGAPAFIKYVYDEKLFENYFNDDTVFGSICKEMKMYADYKGTRYTKYDYQRVLKFKNLVKKTEETEILDITEEMAEKIHVAYPMFNHVGCINSGDLKDLIDYINLTGK